MQGTLRQLRKLRDEEMAAAEGYVNRASKARKEAQDTARKLQERQWQVAFYVDDPTSYWTKHWKDSDFSYLERSMLRDLSIARDAEEKAEFHLARSRKAAAALAKRERKATRRETPGLWTLLQVCLEGRRRRRALVYRSPLPTYHLE